MVKKLPALFSFLFFLPLAPVAPYQPPAPGSSFAYPSPAPAGGTLHVVYNMSQPGTAEVLIYDEAGDLTTQWQDPSVKNAGVAESLVDLYYYKPGVYFYRLVLTFNSGGGQSIGLVAFSVVR